MRFTIRSEWWNKIKNKKKKNEVEMFAIFQTDEYLDLEEHESYPADNRYARAQG